MQLQLQQSNPWRRDIRLLALSRGISVGGAEAGHVALMAFAWHLTGSASHAALVLLAGTIARTFGAPLCGWIGDRANRRVVIMASEALMALTLCGMAMATSLWHLLVLYCVQGFASSTCGSALEASIGTLVPARDLPAANSTMSIARSTGHMLGPLLGGLAVATIGAPTAFLIDAASSVVGGLLVLTIRGNVGGGRATDRSAGHDPAMPDDMLAGVRVIANDPALRLLVAGWCGMCVCFAFVTAAELPLSVSFGMDGPGLGMIVSSWCGGSLVGAWLARRIAVERHGASVLAINAVVCAVVFAGTGLVPAFWCVLVLMAIGGFSMSMAEVVEGTFVQQRIEHGVRARVVAAYQGVFSAVWGMNLALAGLVIDAFSPGVAYVYAGAWCLVGAVGFWLLRRHLRHEEDRRLIRSLRPRAALETALAESDLARGA